jgi:hypothetical protein
MLDEDDLIVTVESLDEPIDTTETTVDTTTKPIVTRTPAKTVKSDDAAIEDLRGQLTAAQRRERDETKRRQEAERIARDNITAATEEVEAARTTVAATRAAAIDGEIASATSESESAAAALQTAMEAGEFAKVPALQRKIANAEARIVDANRRKSDLAEDAPITRTHEGRVEQPQQRQRREPQTEDERVEAILAGCTPKTRAWLEQHMEYVTDPEKAEDAQKAHFLALGNGMQPDTPAYFRYAEKELKRMADEREGGTTVTTEVTPKPKPNGQRRAPVQAAPVDRGGGGSSSADGAANNAVEVTLTRGERDNATNGTIVWNTGPNKGKPIGVQEMARRKLLLSKEGRYASTAAQ